MGFSSLSSVGVGGSVQSVLTQFISNRSQYVVVDGCRSKLVNVVSGVPQGSILKYFHENPSGGGGHSSSRQALELHVM